MKEAVNKKPNNLGEEAATKRRCKKPLLLRLYIGEVPTRKAAFNGGGVDHVLEHSMFLRSIMLISIDRSTIN